MIHLSSNWKKTGCPLTVIRSLAKFFVNLGHHRSQFVKKRQQHSRIATLSRAKASEPGGDVYIGGHGRLSGWEKAVIKANTNWRRSKSALSRRRRFIIHLGWRILPIQGKRGDPQTPKKHPKLSVQHQKIHGTEAHPIPTPPKTSPDPTQRMGGKRDRWLPVQNTQSQEHTALTSSLHLVGVQDVWP